jgi:heat shock protein HslJ
LWGRSFVSTSVTESGRQRPLLPGTRVEVTFEDRQEGGVARWNVGCNTFGAPVVINEDRLNVGDIAGTTMGCAEERYAQDEWSNSFFASDPHWQLIGNRLTLAAGDTTIELVEA